MSKKKEDNMWTDVFLVLPDLNLPWYVKLFNFKTLQDMHERLCHLRMCALESIGKWK